MEECDFCDEEFESEEELHRHWEEHEDELNSHQKEKMKKARRKKQEKEEAKKQKRKTMLFQGTAIIAGLAVVALLGSQLLQGSGTTTGEQTDVNLEGQPMMGNPNASVTIVEFGDYRCPYCQQFDRQVFPQLKDEYIDTGKVNFYFVNYPFLDAHFPGRTSERAAIAGECAYDQNKTAFWDYHKSIYENQGAEDSDWATQETLMNIARESTDGLDYNELEACISNRDTLDEVNHDMQVANSAGVDSTPYVLVNGKQVSNWRYSNLKSVIEKELN